MSVTDWMGSAQYRDVPQPAIVITPLPTVEFPAVYAAELGYVWSTLRRLGVQERDLDDLCHDVFVIVFRNLAVYDARRPIRPWLFGIAFRVASDYRRSARHRREVAGTTREVVCPAPPADEVMLQRERQRLVLRALETLELDRRAVFVMHDIDGHVMPDIAVALGVPLNTAYSRLRLARADFAEAVRRAQGGQR
ncbi:MAG TPA: RNA polymerase sigma factor [Polyangia bacterium]|nr:RNA polymerase sigma factor [Polyangia bacterium]